MEKKNKTDVISGDILYSVIKEENPVKILGTIFFNKENKSKSILMKSRIYDIFYFRVIKTRFKNNE